MASYWTGDQGGVQRQAPGRGIHLLIRCFKVPNEFPHPRGLIDI
jgi:hypothetical protein